MDSLDRVNEEPTAEHAHSVHDRFDEVLAHNTRLQEEMSISSKITTFWLVSGTHRTGLVGWQCVSVGLECPDQHDLCQR